MCTCSTGSAGAGSWSASRCRPSPPQGWTRPGRAVSRARRPAATATGHGPPPTGTPCASRSAGSPSCTTPQCSLCAFLRRLAAAGSAQLVPLDLVPAGVGRGRAPLPRPRPPRHPRRDHRRRRRRPGLPRHRRLDRLPVGPGASTGPWPTGSAPRPAPGSPRAPCSPRPSGAGASSTAADGAGAVPPGRRMGVRPGAGLGAITAPACDDGSCATG